MTFKHNKAIIFGLITALLFGSSCVKRVNLKPDDRELKSYKNTIFLHLKPSMEYLGKSLLRIENPKIESQYLIGYRKRKQISIPLENIELIQIQQFDTKKTMIASAAFISLSSLIVLLGSGIGKANVD